MICLYEEFRSCLKSPDVSRRIWNHRVHASVHCAHLIVDPSTSTHAQ